MRNTLWPMALLASAIVLPLAAHAEPASEGSGPTRGGDSRLGWTWLAAQYDKDANAAVTREELPAEPRLFACLDRTWDGVVSADDFDWSDHGSLARQKETTFALFKAMDRNSDGRLSGQEWQAAFALAAGDGPLHESELNRLLHFPAAAKAQRERRSRAEGRLAAFEAEQPRGQTPEVGALAPDFDLATPDGARRTRLSSYRDKRPVVLIFGSFT